MQHEPLLEQGKLSRCGMQINQSMKEKSWLYNKSD